MKHPTIGLRGVPRAVWALGFVSLFMDISSEMIHSLLPVFLVTILGASPALFGFIEGIAEATASITKLFSGWLSDRLARRKLLAVAGYGLSALTKLIFPLAAMPYEVLAARFLDRVGKGIRDAPRNALVADVAPSNVRGAAYGLRQALDTVGAFAGPLIAMGLMALYAGDMRAVFWWAVLPGAIAVLVLILGVQEPAHLQTQPADRAPINSKEVRGFGPAYWAIVAVGAVFTMARFSEGFLILRALDVGLPAVLVPVVMIAMNVVYAGVATPAGQLSDHIDRRWILAGGFAALVAADLVLALWDSVAGAVLGAALWGLHMGLSEGLLAALVADAAPVNQRGTAFGVFHLVSGVVLFAASAIAGLLWETNGAAGTFLAGASFAGVALLGLLAAMRRGK